MSGELVGKAPQEPTRTVTPRIQDYYAAAVDGVSIAPSRQIAESKIAEFCGGCDQLGADNVCETVGANDQGRYTDRGWCGWASVNGVRGQMTGDGFVSSESQPQTPPDEQA